MKLHLEDLSLSTLEHIRNDLTRHAHLTMYRKVWSEIVLTIEERNRMSQGMKNIPNITGVPGGTTPLTQPRPQSYTSAAQQLLNPKKED